MEHNDLLHWPFGCFANLDAMDSTTTIKVDLRY